ncbi:MAG: hypothetical protein ACIAXF_00845 [Phycisphaerales bacterium JB063]
MRWRSLTRCGLAALAAGLCVWGAGCSQAKVAGDGRAVDAPDRIPALVRQAEAERDADGSGLRSLIVALDDEDPAVRMFAAEALRERSGETFGYRYYDSAEARRPAVRRWRAWARQQQAPQSPETPAPNDNTAAVTPVP